MKKKKRKYVDELRELVEEEKWIKKFLTCQGFCIICDHDDPMDLEFHEPGRKRNDLYLSVSVCRNCHGRFSRKQRWWPKESLRQNNPPLLKEGFVLLGLADIFAERARRAHDTDIAHAMVGHTTYLDMYDRKDDSEKLELFLKVEPSLKIFNERFYSLSEE